MSPHLINQSANQSVVVLLRDVAPGALYDRHLSSVNALRVSPQQKRKLLAIDRMTIHALHLYRVEKIPPKLADLLNELRPQTLKARSAQTLQLALFVRRSIEIGALPLREALSKDLASQVLVLSRLGITCTRVINQRVLKVLLYCNVVSFCVLEHQSKVSNHPVKGG